MKCIRIGTINSQLALVQTQKFLERLYSAYPAFKIPGSIEIVEFDDETSLYPNIEKQLLSGDIDMVVSSMKKVPLTLDDKVEIACCLPRENPWDCFVSTKYKSLEELPDGAKVCVGNVNCSTVMKKKRPDIQVVPCEERDIETLNDVDVDAFILSIADLRDFGQEDKIISVFDNGETVPTSGQGVIGIITRKGKSQTKDFLSKMNCLLTQQAVFAERMCLNAILSSIKDVVVSVYAFYTGGNTLNIQVMASKKNGALLMLETFSSVNETMDVFICHVSDCIIGKILK